MENLRTLETQVLMEMLLQQTVQLTGMIAGKEPGNVDQYKYDLAMIQAELNARQQPKDSTTISDMGIEFTSPSHPAAAIPDPGTESSIVQ